MQLLHHLHFIRITANSCLSATTPAADDGNPVSLSGSVPSSGGYLPRSSFRYDAGVEEVAVTRE
ncbi:MAG: hypothetical protein RIG68_09430 [Imperialibacter sp.]|uniref:hypothetical protein n=1 Tax=Imperialibacter sp. TaxID=2038411 RepID=UPI0032EFB6C3